MSAQSRVGVRLIEENGRGVIAYNGFHIGEHIETCYTIQLDATELPQIAGTNMDASLLIHPVDPEGALLALGLVSLCGFSELPNTRITARKDGPIGWLLDLHALRDISPGEQLTRHVRCDLWFDETD